MSRAGPRQGNVQRAIAAGFPALRWPGAFSVTMASGILSIAAAAQHFETLSWALLAVAVAVGIALAVAQRRELPARLGRARLPPDVAFAALTFVAAAAVVGSRLAAPNGVRFVLAVALWALAAAAWISLAPAGWRLLTRPGPAVDAARGEWCLAAVAPASLAVLAAELAAMRASRPWQLVAIVLWLVAIAAYALALTALARRLARRGLQLAELTPDWWIVMGALAIICLAASAIGTSEALTAAKVAWIVATALVPPLALAFALRLAIAGIGKAMTLWAGVFPLGMYSVASQRLSPLAGWPALHEVARLFLWVGLAAWALTLAATVWDERR